MYNKIPFMNFSQQENDLLTHLKITNKKSHISVGRKLKKNNDNNLERQIENDFQIQNNSKKKTRQESLILRHKNSFFAEIELTEQTQSVPLARGSSLRSKFSMNLSIQNRMPMFTAFEMKEKSTLIIHETEENTCQNYDFKIQSKNKSKVLKYFTFGDEFFRICKELVKIEPEQNKYENNSEMSCNYSGSIDLYPSGILKTTFEQKDISKLNRNSQLEKKRKSVKVGKNKRRNFSFTKENRRVTDESKFARKTKQQVKKCWL